MVVKKNKKERWYMKNENRNMKENALQEIMYYKLICYGIIVFFCERNIDNVR